MSIGAPAGSTTPHYREPILPHTPPPVVDHIETVLEDQVVFTPQGATSHYLVKWKDRSVTDATWISEEEFCHLDADLVKQYQHSTSTESSSLPSKRVDGDCHSSCTDVRRRFCPHWMDGDFILS